MHKNKYFLHFTFSHLIYCCLGARSSSSVVFSILLFFFSLFFIFIFILLFILFFLRFSFYFFIFFHSFYYIFPEICFSSTYHTVHILYSTSVQPQSLDHEIFILPTRPYQVVLFQPPTSCFALFCRLPIYGKSLSDISASLENLLHWKIVIFLAVASKVC